MTYHWSQAERGDLALAGRAEGGGEEGKHKNGLSGHSRAHGPPLQTRPKSKLGVKQNDVMALVNLFVCVKPKDHDYSSTRSVSENYAVTRAADLLTKLRSGKPATPPPSFMVKKAAINRLVPQLSVLLVRIGF
jgi:hypothetical protein